MWLGTEDFFLHKIFAMSLLCVSFQVYLVFGMHLKVTIKTSTTIKTTYVVDMSKIKKYVMISLYNKIK